MKIDKNAVVSFHYTLTDSAGNTLDSSDGGEPLAYLHGHGAIIPGLEAQMEGRVEGDSFKVTIQPEDGYGAVDASLIQRVPASMFQGVEQIEPGMEFHAQGMDGSMRVVRVTEVGALEVTVDANHPLAGEVLNFDVAIDSVRAASEEELSHGHVHGPGGHHH